MRTKARTEKAKAAVPKVTPVARRQENTANTFKSSSLAFSFHSVHTSDFTSCLTNLKQLMVNLDFLIL